MNALVRQINTVDSGFSALGLTTDSERSVGDLWPEVYERVVSQLSGLDTAARHVNDLTNLSKANRELEVHNLTLGML